MAVTDLKNKFLQYATLQRLIVLNIVIFLIINLLDVGFTLFSYPDEYISSGFDKWLAVPSSLPVLITRPWTIITYEFMHYGIFHILFNMLWLYFMGRLFVEYLGGKKLLAVYLVGGIAGAALYIAAYNIFPVFANAVHSSFALGASASVLAITAAIATLIPNYSVNLFFPGFIVKLKYIALFQFAVDLLSITGSNAGGSIAHVGGAIFGFVFTRQLQRGNDLTLWMQKITGSIQNIFNNKQPVRVVHRRSNRDDDFKRKKAQNQEVIDRILDKISKSGYSSLTAEEKEMLFNASKNQN